MVREELRFIGIHDFYHRCDLIKQLYDKMSIEEKSIYKYYIYSRRRIREYTCDVIWEFLNEESDSEFVKTKEMLYSESLKCRI